MSGADQRRRRAALAAASQRDSADPSLPDERTLDVLVRSLRTAPDAASVTRPLGPQRANLGIAFLGLGAALIVAVRAAFGFAYFVGQFTQDEYSATGPAIAAWIVLVVSCAAVFVAVRLVGDQLSRWISLVFFVALAAVVALDVYAVWGTGDIGGHLTAGTTAIMALLIVLTARPTRELVIACSVLGAGLAVAMALHTPFEADALAAQLAALASAVLPIAVGVVVVSGFRRMVQIELDRALVQSTVSAPRFAVGMLASEELARLDLAAEDLLDSVASGKQPLPLDPDTASIAASLATELRLHLIEGRRETWLYHAITESELLGRAVTLEDKSALAGLLDPGQRDGLLGAIWMLVADVSNLSDARTLALTVGPIAPPRSDAPPRRILVPVVIETTHVPRNRVDPSTWDALRRVGRYSDSTQAGSLRVEIECYVENPADR